MWVPVPVSRWAALDVLGEQSYIRTTLTNHQLNHKSTTTIQSPGTDLFILVVGLIEIQPFVLVSGYNNNNSF